MQRQADAGERGRLGSPARRAGTPGGAYFTIHGGPQPLKLIDVSSDVAIGSEMHEGGMAMKKVAAVDIPAGGTVTFQRAGGM